MSRPKTKEETGTIRVRLKFRDFVIRGAKKENMSVPDFVDKHFPVVEA
ncbi:MAG: hypothetical protein M0Q91_05520 [Methanoregula sp.]|jgi:hypothetical protein|nr:hypothetical protein [Methanoregula sp.]